MAAARRTGPGTHRAATSRRRRLGPWSGLLLVLLVTGILAATPVAAAEFEAVGTPAGPVSLVPWPAGPGDATRTPAGTGLPPGPGPAADRPALLASTGLDLTTPIVVGLVLLVLGTLAVGWAFLHAGRPGRAPRSGRS